MTNSADPKLGKTLLDDLLNTDWRQSLRRDYRELRRFYITPEQEEELKSMSRLKAVLYIFYWLFRSMLLKLSSTRRLLFAVSLILIFAFPSMVFESKSARLSIQWPLIGGVILLFIFMLELKDKLLATDELQSGRAVQLALLPDRIPQVSGWDIWLFSRPANDVGGDLIDFIPISRDRFAIVLGDVAGKGLPAALFMARLQAIIRVLAPDFESLAEMAKKLNQIFYRDSLASSFASLVYLEINPSDGRIRFFNAGHIPPVLLRSFGVEEMAKGSPALGIMNSAQYEEKEVELKPNEWFVIYSDGVSEARNDRQEFFGEHTVHNLLKNNKYFSAQQLGEKILLEVDRFTGESGYGDDLSLVILKRRF
jgi:hypothetical protein